jgi:hypothetical protein
MKKDLTHKMRNTWYRSPIATVLAVLLICNIPGMPQLPFVSRASAQSLCLPSSPPNGQSSILQTCSSDSDLETLAVQDWATRHDIPLSEIPLAYQYGRAGLRSELRAHIFTYLLAIIRKPAGDRTATETQIYNWMQNAVWQHQQAQYLAAITDRNNWMNDKCHWRPDSAVAQVYGLTYDSSTYCGLTGLAALFSIAPSMPSKDYFLAAALKNTYGKNVANATGGPAVLSNLNRDYQHSVNMAVVGGAAITGVLAGSLVSWLAVAGAWYYNANFIADGITAASSIGAATIVITAVLIGAIATFEVVMNQEKLDELATLDSEYQHILNVPPDLEGFSRDQTGFYKLVLTFTENAVPDFPSSTPLPSGHSGDRVFVITPQGGTPQASPNFSYADWYNTRWTAKTYGQWLTHTGVDSSSNAVSEFSPTFRFLDWNGNHYTASRKSFHFVVSKNNPKTTDTMCIPNATGVSPQTDVSGCSVYVTDSLKLKDSSGNNVTIAIAGAPAFTSNTAGALLVGTPSSFNITATGNPLPAISLFSPTLPGVSFQDSSVLGLGQARISYDGSTLLPAGSYPFVLAATNAQGQVLQTVTLTISSPVTILSPTQVSFMAGAPFSYTVTVAGSPRPTLTCPGSLFGQVSFIDNQNGSATFTGTLSGPPLDGGLYLRPSCYLTATNGVTGATALMLFESTPAPVATITSATTGTFANLTTGGQPTGINGLPITTTGASTPVTFDFPCGDQPFWLTVTNNGDGTGSLSGNPPYYATKSSFTLRALAAGSQPPAPQCATPNYTIQSQLMPYFADPLYATQTVGFPYTFQTLGTIPGAVVSLNGAMPPNVTFQDTSFGSWSISGTPPIGSGGEYRPEITMTVGGASETRILRLIVLESPTLHSPQTLIFPLGLKTSFPVSASGFPKAQLDGIPGLNSNSMRFKVTGTLPAGISLTDTDASGTGTPVGAGLLSGTPAPNTLGTYPITITADNGVAPAATEYATVLVTLPGDVNNDGHVDCTDVSLLKAAYGSYRGTAKYDARADINADGVVDIRDLSLLSSKLPAGTKCP